MLIHTTLKWPNGKTPVRIVNWNDKNDVRGFAAASRRCLAKGGEVISRATTKEEKDEYAAASQANTIRQYSPAPVSHPR